MNLSILERFQLSTLLIVFAAYAPKLGFPEMADEANVWIERLKSGEAAKNVEPIEDIAALGVE